MKKLFTLLFFSLPLFVWSQNFTTGNLVVSRVGDGSAALTSGATPVFLDEYTTNGILTQSLSIPTATSGSRLVLSGTASTEGVISRSVDGRFILLAGYDTSLITTNPNSASESRVISLIDKTKAIDFSTRFSYGSSAIRTAVSPNGTDFWFAGASLGQYFVSKGSSATTLVSSTITNSRVLGIAGGQLYLSTASGTNNRVGAIGTGLPTTTSNTFVGLTGLPTTGSPYQFFFADLDQTVAGVDVLYLADDASGTGLMKYSLVNGTWVANGNISVTGGSLRGLTGIVSGNNVTIYGVSPTNLVTLTDATGYNGSLTGSFTTLATASTNTAFRGISLAPEGVLPVTLKSISASLINNQPQVNWETSNETNFDYFGVEKSFDAKNFAEIARVASNKASNGSTYQYADINKTLSTQFYRLRMVDNDGTFKYSSVVAVNAKSTISLALYPNPVTNTIILSHPKAIAGAAVKVTGIDGKILATQNVQTGATQTSIDATRLVKGNYVVSFVNDGVSSTTQLVKQ